MNRIVLASASPRRCELLKQIGLDFDVLPSDIDERFVEDRDAASYVRRLAQEKAMHAANRTEAGSLAVGADTVVVDGTILGKPGDDAEAFDMLKRLSGRWHDVYTGLSVVEAGTLKHAAAVERTRVKMRALSEKDIRSYIATGEPRDKAGAYGIQGFGALLVERIEGCYFNVVGLPIYRLSVLLESFGVHILNSAGSGGNT